MAATAVLMDFAPEVPRVQTPAWKPLGQTSSPYSDLDPAKITDKLFKYTGDHDPGFEIHEAARGAQKLVVIAIEAVSVPIVFTSPGTYLDPTTGKQKTAFSRGTVYFRHGAKSEPGTSNDLRLFVERWLELARKAWLGKIRKIVEAPADAQVAIYRPASSDAAGQPTQIQLTTDPKAPVYGKLDPDETHPYRQKELINEGNRKLPGKASINAYDVLCVRKTGNIDEATEPRFCHLPKFGSLQYSDAFVEWLTEQYGKDKEFFVKARSRFYERAHGGK